MAIFTYFQLTDAVLPQLNSLLLVVVPVSSITTTVHSYMMLDAHAGYVSGCAELQIRKSFVHEIYVRAIRKVFSCKLIPQYSDSSSYLSL